MPQETDKPRPHDGAPTKTMGRPARALKKKKSLFEWIMLAIGLSYGDEGEDKWARQREAAAASEQKQSSNPETRT